MVVKRQCPWHKLRGKSNACPPVRKDQELANQAKGGMALWPSMAWSSGSESPGHIQILEAHSCGLVFRRQPGGGVSSANTEVSSSNMASMLGLPFLGVLTITRDLLLLGAVLGPPVSGNSHMLIPE